MRIQPTLKKAFLPTTLMVKAKHNNPIVFVECDNYYLVPIEDVLKLPDAIKKMFKLHVNYNMGFFRKFMFDSLLKRTVDSGNRVAIVTQLN